jgi:phage-related minor tail protein
MIMNMADAAMKEAEASMKSGEDKKQMVIDSVKAGCKAAGVNLDEFIDQLGDYIDQTISFVNGMKK